MNLRRTLKVSAIMVASVPLLIGCGGSDNPPANPGTASSAGASDGTVRLLSTVYYNGKLSDEYTYDEAGKPLTHVHYHPVTGEKSSTLTVTKMDDAGRVTEATHDSGSGKGKVVYEYDAEGRRTSIVHFNAAGSETSRSTYAHDGDVITQSITSKGRGWKIIYTLDGGGNVISQRWVDGSRDQTHKFSDFDGKPNPWTLTAGVQDEYPLSRNNYRHDATYAGCEFTSVHQYNDDGLLTQTESTGCTGPNGSPTKHKFRYEYVTL